MNVEILPSLAALEAAAPAWDDLWARSDAPSPLLRAERVAAWCRQFAPGAPFQAVVVTEGGRYLAALPLVQAHRFARVLAQTPNNHWSATGDLLLDAATPAPELAQAVATGLRRLPWPCIAGRLVPCTGPGWQVLAAAAAAEGLLCHCERTEDVGYLRVDPAAPGHVLQRSRSHRRNVQRAVRRLEDAGGRCLRVLQPTAVAEVERLMDEGFALEDTGWKGRHGTSVVRVRGMRDYFVGEACSLASRGELLLYFLDHGGRAIAFQYAFRTKGWVLLSKMGYDDEHAKLSPGHVLTLDMLTHLETGTQPVDVEFGPMNEATAHWTDRSYPVGTVVIGQDTVAGRVAFAAVCRALQWKHRRRRAVSAPAS